MASPQPENGHIDIANTIADKFCSYRLSGQEWQIVWVVLRKTWGWLENPENPKSSKKKVDRIALSQFYELTGIDRRKCHSIIKKLIKKNVLKKVVTQKGDKIIIRYGLQKDFDLWKVSPKKVTVTQKGDKLSPKKATKVSPKKAHTKETLKETITKDIADFPKSATNEKVYLTKSGKKLTGKRLESFDEFWDTFNFKHGKASAADSWFKIPVLTDQIVNKILIAAKIESNKRPELEKKGQTPKWAQGWITERRWEDEAYQQPEKEKIPVFRIVSNES